MLLHLVTIKFLRSSTMKTNINKWKYKTEIDAFRHLPNQNACWTSLFTAPVRSGSTSHKINEKAGDSNEVLSTLFYRSFQVLSHSYYTVGFLPQRLKGGHKERVLPESLQVLHEFPGGHQHSHP